MLSWNRNGVYEEIRAGRLKSFRLGRRRLIRVAELEAYLERRELLTAGTPAPPRRAQPTSECQALPFPGMGVGVTATTPVSPTGGRGRSARNTKKAAPTCQ